MSVSKHGSKMTEKSPQSKGGAARANALTPRERSEIAKRAAQSRWAGDLPMADFEGSFSIGNTQVAAAVLRDETRIITQASYLRALGRSRSPKAGTGVLSTVDELPFFLQAEAFKPFITNELIESTKSIFYKTKKGSKGVGYNAISLKRVADVYLQFRDVSLKTNGKFQNATKGSSLRRTF